MNQAMASQAGIKKLIVVGCGLHFRERYFDVLEAKAVHITLIVDLISQKEKILAFLATQKWQVEKLLFLSEDRRHFLTPELIGQLVEIPSGTEGVIISTEPKAHKPYALWAIQNGLNVFIDKPLTAFSTIEEMDTLYDDYLEIAAALKKSPVNFVVACERRAHPGYLFLQEYLSDVIHKTGIPITFIDIHFGGGKWHMPDEFFYMENHPYKYGYGILLHSGYHYIDLFITLLGLNGNFSIDDLTFHLLYKRSHHFLETVGSEPYRQFFKTSRFESYFEPEKVDQMRVFGESDVMLMGEWKKVTQFCIKLTDTSVAKRSWSDLPENTYLHNGRVRQENVIIHVGPMCSVQITSHPQREFSMDILNNGTLLEKEPYIQIQKTGSLNVEARKWQLADFLKGGDGNSPLASHESTIRFLDQIYRVIKCDVMASIDKSKISSGVFSRLVETNC